MECGTFSFIFTIFVFCFLFLIVFLLYCLYDVPTELLMLDYPLKNFGFFIYLVYVQGIIHSINRVIPA